MTNDTLEYTRYDAARDQAAVVRMLIMAFAGPSEGTLSWLASAGEDNLRVVRSNGQTLGCLLRIPMAQYFGGATVPMVGIAGVAVAPEARGMGIARFLMQQAMLECAAEGTPLSTLYASTQSLYRQVGYEQAGHAFNIKIPIAQLAHAPREGRVHALVDADLPAIEACSRDFAASFNGHPARGPYLWNRVREFRKESYTPFGVRAPDGSIDGYLFMRQQRKPETGRQDVHLSDVAFRTKEAGHLLLGFVKDFASMADDLHLSGGPHHPLLGLMDQQRYSIHFKDFWMLRLTSVGPALRSRRYPRPLSATITFEVQDETIPENAGVWILTVQNGSGTAEKRKAAATARIHVRALAAFYSGFMSGPDALRAGLADGDPATLTDLATLFAGPTPWMQDFF
ncbi:MAG: GNAT family N-acetyltransferase [Phycisphaerales bacterium]